MKLPSPFSPLILWKWKKHLLRIIARQNKPQFLIVGAQKCGTTSLFFYLSQHPSLIGSKIKEIDFFNWPHAYEKGIKAYSNNFKRFEDPFGKKISYEGSTGYLYRPETPQRIYDYNKKMKIIIILREPVARAFSAWNMYKDIPGSSPKLFEQMKQKVRDDNMIEEYYGGNQFPSFEEVVQRELERIEENSAVLEPSVIRRGIYLPQIKRYHDLFGKEQVLILGIGELRKDKIQVLNKILKFLGIKENTWEFLDEEPRNSRTYQEKISPSMKGSLKRFYEPHNEALFDYLGKEIDW